VPVEVVSPDFEDGFEALASAEGDRVRLKRSAYGDDPLAAYCVVIAATDDEAVNAQVYADARKAGVPVNVVDDPERCTFFVPATVTRGGLQLTVGTGGASPSLARRIRQDLEELYPEAYADYIEALEEVRAWVKEIEPDLERRKELLTPLATVESFEQVRELSRTEVVDFLKKSISNIQQGMSNVQVKDKS
jgi:precorrin-2 dehydrogenase/sirohydrochlorin ferrochelatase